MSESVSPATALRLYGGVSLNCWTRTHHEPASWEAGQAIARVLADGGEHKIVALYPAGVSLREETVPVLSREQPVVKREETFPCTRMQVAPVERPRVDPVAPAVKAEPKPAPAAPAPGAMLEGGLFGGDW